MEGVGTLLDFTSLINQKLGPPGISVDGQFADDACSTIGNHSSQRRVSHDVIYLDVARGSGLIARRRRTYQYSCKLQFYWMYGGLHLYLIP